MNSNLNNDAFERCVSLHNSSWAIFTLKKIFSKYRHFYGYTYKIIITIKVNYRNWKMYNKYKKYKLRLKLDEYRKI